MRVHVERSDSLDDRHRVDDRHWVDDRNWPLLVVRWPSGPVDDLQLVRAFDRIREIVARDEAHVVLLRADDARAPTRVQLGLLLDLVRWAAPRSRCIAIAVVTRSSIVRATVDSLRWTALMGSRWETFEDDTAAARWLEGIVRREERQPLGDRAPHGRGAPAERPASIPPPE